MVDAEQLEVGRALRERCASLEQLVFDGPARSMTASPTRS